LPGDSSRYVGSISDDAFKIFDSVNKKFTPLTLPIENLKQTWVSDSGVILLGTDTTLRWKSFDGTQEKIIATSTAGFTLEGGLIYILQSDKIVSTSLDSLEKEPNTISNQLTAFKNGMLLVMPHKEIFCLLDGTLYQVSTENLTPLHSDVTSAGLDAVSESLWWQAGGAIYYYQYGLTGPRLITRSQSPITALTFHPDSRYLFYIQENRLQATELKTDAPNEYTLSTVDNGRKLLNTNDDVIYLLDGDRLLSIDF
jgi:hypothetical protein